MTMPHSVGMGLAVARSLAVLMGGSLDYMHDGKESIFRLTLPACPYDR
jgi:signal transduction histidine kinase